MIVIDFGERQTYRFRAELTIEIVHVVVDVIVVVGEIVRCAVGR